MIKICINTLQHTSSRRWLWRWCRPPRLSSRNGVQEALWLPFASRRCGLKAPPRLDVWASLHFGLGAVRSQNIGPCAPCGASPPVPWAAQYAWTRERGPHLLVLACASDSTRRPVVRSRFACPSVVFVSPSNGG